MRALISGATGYVGGRLARRLSQNGHEVHALLREQSDASGLKGLRGLVIHRHRGGVDSLREIVRKAAPEMTFHLAARFAAEHQPEDVPGLVESNIAFGAMLADAICDLAAPLMINAGTSWQHYGQQEYNPVNLYAATKEAMEDILRYYVEAKGLNLLTLKIFDTYGPDDPRPKLFNLLAKIAKSGEELAMSPGGQLLDLVHVDDAAGAFERAGELLLSGRITGMKEHTVSSGDPVRLRDLVAAYEKARRVKLNIRWGKRPYRMREVMTPWRGGRRLPGWEPRISLARGLAELGG